jgi:hypothetical protein
MKEGSQPLSYPASHWSIQASQCSRLKPSYEFCFEGFIKFQPFNWRVGSNPRRQSKTIETKYKTRAKRVRGNERKSGSLPREFVFKPPSKNLCAFTTFFFVHVYCVTVSSIMIWFHHFLYTCMDTVGLTIAPPPPNLEDVARLLNCAKNHMGAIVASTTFSRLRS